MHRRSWLKALCTVFIILASGLVLVPLPAKADTYVSGIIIADTTWNSTGSPYIVTGNLTVASQANLTIQGDVLIKVDPNVTMTIQGALRVAPVQNLAASFTNNSTGRWGGIIANGSRLFRMMGGSISASKTAVELINTKGAIFTNVKMENNTLDMMLTNSTGGTVNSTMNWSRVSVDATSRLAVANVLRVYIGDMNGGLRNGDLQVRDGNKTIYATRAYGGNDSRTNAQGYSPPILVVDRVFDGPNVVENRTYINASYQQVPFPMREVDMSASHVESFVIADPYLIVGKTVTGNPVNLMQPTPVRVVLQARGLNNTTVATGIEVIDLLPLDIKYLAGSSSKPVWASTDGQGRARLQWNITSMNASEQWNVTYRVYGTQVGTKSVAVIPPSGVNYTSNSTPKQAPMPDVKITFVLAPLSIRITSPTGFAIWRIQDTRFINWTATGGQPPVRVNLAYRPMTGQQWTEIARNLPENGSHSWQVPMTALGIITLRAQARDALGNTTNATATVIVIPRFLVLITPASATVQLNFTQTFTARAIEVNGTPLPSDKVMFTWSLGNTTVGKIDPMGGNVTTFTAIGPGTDTLTCIALYEGSPSAGLATVTVPTPPPPVVTVLSPTGGDKYPEGSEVNITWKATSMATPLTVNVSYSKDSGATYTTIASSIPQPKSGSMSHIWKLPGGLSGKKVIVNVSATDRFDQAGSDESGEFSILVPMEMRYISGDNQTGDVATRLKEPLVVQVLTDGMMPLEGVRVNWSLIAYPNGSTLHALESLQEATDSVGMSRASLTLGQIPGDYTVEARVEGSWLAAVKFNEKGESGPITEAYIFPTRATLEVDEPQTFTLTLYDRFNNSIPVPAANVTWSIKGVGEVIKGIYSSPSAGDANVSATIKYKGASVTVSAQVTVVAKDTTLGWAIIGLILLVFLLLLLFLLYRRRASRRPPKVLEEETKKQDKDELEPPDTEEKKSGSSEEKEKEKDTPKEEKPPEKKVPTKKVVKKVVKVKRTDSKGKD